jgi:hypothetical protein
MSTYEYMMGMGENGNGIELGPGVPVPPEEPVVGGGIGENLDAFIAKLKAEKGPFVYVGKDSPEGKKFITWMSLYDPTFIEWMMKLAMVKMSAAALAVSETVSAIPEWVTGETIQFRKGLYDMYLSCSARVENMLATQGKILSNAIPPIEFENFIKWWRSYDLPGAAALIAKYTANAVSPLQMPVVELPKKLFDFWKTTGGTVEPPKPLLGFGQSWLDWALDNWLWLAGGAAGGVLIGRWYMKRKNQSPRDTVVDMGTAPTMLQNARCDMGVPARKMTANMQEGWGQTLQLKSGTYELRPILTDAYVARSTAANMRAAKKFRVSSEGYNLGELHKSSGKRRWRARSYYGAEKYGNSRAALLEWLKEGAAAGAMASALRRGQRVALPEPVAEEAAEAAVEAMAANMSREVL